MDLYALVFRSFYHQPSTLVFTMIKGELYLIGNNMEWDDYEELIKFDYLVELEKIDYDKKFRNKYNL